MAQPPQELIPALDLFRRGDAAGARAAAEAALAAAPDNVEISAFAGLAAARAGDPAGAVPHFRRVVEALPGDDASRANLAMALLAAGERDEAGAVAAAGGETPRLLRIAAFVHQERGRLGEAARAYRAVIAAVPQDWESHNNLGNALAAAGDHDGAIAAFEQAIRLRPDRIEMIFNLSETLAQAERTADRQQVLRAATAADPDNGALQAELGMAEAGAQDFVAAEAAFRTALRLDPANLSAWLELGLLLENLNRTDELVALVEAAKAARLGADELRFLEAWALRRQSRFAEALALAEQVPETVSPVRRAHLLAELYDRTGRPHDAFARFAEMNAASAALRPPPPGPSYRETIAARAAELTPAWVDSWRPLDLPASPPAPVFIIGFPRSGTTLLDTLLMNLPRLHVLEELPMLASVEAGIAPGTDLAAISPAEGQALRAYYFERLAALAPLPAGRIPVDKHPLHMARIPLLHRLFPDARIVFVERHPCDVVLSCFMANFTLNQAMRSFVDLNEAAQTYDAVFACWTRAAALLPLKVHRIRYERMVADLEGEMQPLLQFLGLPWDANVLDNQKAAAARGHVRTASYAQVTEPIYTRSAGRWQNYRAEMETVLPILRPWAEKMGYEI